LASNTADILTKQDLITTSTDLIANSITTNSLEVNGGVRIDTSTYFDTVVIRRFDEANTTLINLNELQVLVNGSNILVENSTFLTDYFTNRANKQVDFGSFLNNSPVSNL
jgi:hypothetical protein